MLTILTKSLCKKENLISGTILIVLGLFFSIYSYIYYSIGELNQPDYGFFPFYLGIILASLGFVIVIKSLFFNYDVEPTQVEWKSLFYITLSIFLFWLLINPVGLILTSLISVFISTIFLPFTQQQRLLVMLVVTATVYVIFVLGFKLTISLWPNWLYFNVR
jgi:4-hydroxybenzoate polyprenyltransferase